MGANRSFCKEQQERFTLVPFFKRVTRAKEQKSKFPTLGWDGVGHTHAGSLKHTYPGWSGVIW